jgi:amidohydrolase
MIDSKAMKKKVQEEVDIIFTSLKEIKDKIGRNPELGSEEKMSSMLLVEELKRHGFKVEYPFCNMDTAFKAVYKGKKNGSKIAILSEYDALPGVGHGCGHNIIGTAAIGAGIAVSKLMKELDGEIWVLGTPAEEGHGPYASAKTGMVNAGVFNDVDVSYMIHPMIGTSMVNVNALAVSKISIEFKGKTAHAAADPHNGVNALNAACLTYMAIHANRQQLRRDANAVIHGIITEGGLANNIIPDKASLMFGVRSSDTMYIPELVEMVVNSAKGAAIATGCKVVTNVLVSRKSNVPNKPLEELYQRIFDELGHKYMDPFKVALLPPHGSTDFADVTHVVPGIHPLIGLTQQQIAMHSSEFAAVTLTPEGDKGLEIGAKAMAMATIEILTTPELLEKIKADFETRRL